MVTRDPYVQALAALLAAYGMAVFGVRKGLLQWRAPRWRAGHRRRRHR